MRHLIRRLEEAYGGGGSGSGKYKKGRKMKVSDFDSVKEGDLMIQDSKQFGTINLVRITGRGKIGKNLTAIFVDPKNPKKKRLPSDREFTIWDTDLGNGELFAAKR